MNNLKFCHFLWSHQFRSPHVQRWEALQGRDFFCKLQHGAGRIGKADSKSSGQVITSSGARQSSLQSSLLSCWDFTLSLSFSSRSAQMISETPFLCLASVYAQELLDYLKQFDKDGKGALSKEELQEVMRGTIPHFKRDQHRWADEVWSDTLWRMPQCSLELLPLPGSELRPGWSPGRSCMELGMDAVGCSDCRLPGSCSTFKARQSLSKFVSISSLLYIWYMIYCIYI